MIWYFAYGSNLHPVRLMERVPSARLIGIAILNEHILAFNKRSKDGSSKCNIFRTGNESDLVYGAVYQLDQKHKNTLDHFEVKGFGYLNTRIRIQLDKTSCTCLTYIAQQLYIADNLKPYSWYKELVLLGARYLNLPEKYISDIARVKSVVDPDSSRRDKNEELIESVRNYR